MLGHPRALARISLGGGDFRASLGSTFAHWHPKQPGAVWGKSSAQQHLPMGRAALGT